MQASPPAAVVPPRRWRRRLIVGALLLGVLLVVALGGLVCAATYRPGWYQPAAIRFDRLPADKQAFVALLDSISAALNHGEPIEVVVEQDQLNRWLAGRREVFPPDWERFEQLRDPFVQILPERRLRLAARIRQGGFAAIASVGLRITAGPETIRLDTAALRVGLLPVPTGWLGGELAARLPRRARVRVELRNGVLEVPNRLVWPNGRRRFRIASLRSEAGRLFVRLEPL